MRSNKNKTREFIVNLKNFRMFLPIVAIATVCQSNQKKMEDKKFMSGEKAGVAGMQSAHVEKSNKSNVIVLKVDL